jgi:hypothetical protein
MTNKPSGRRKARLPAASAPQAVPARRGKRLRRGQRLKSERVQGRAGAASSARTTRPPRAPAGWRWAKGRRRLERIVTLPSAAVSYALAAGVCALAAQLDRRMDLFVEGRTIRFAVGSEAQGVSQEDSALLATANVLIDLAQRGREAGPPRSRG